MPIIGSSRFFNPLVRRYSKAPSIILCRVPELELLSQIELIPPVMDHCCGDGFIASLAFPELKLDVGVDLSQRQLKSAKKARKYGLLARADAGCSLPFKDSSFRTIINNSGIEHIPNLKQAVSELSRILTRGGKIYFNVLNSRYFDRWPLNRQREVEYRQFQPFYHAFEENTWLKILRKFGFDNISFADYLSEGPSRLLAELDYRYSAHHFGKEFFITIALRKLVPKCFVEKKWRQAFENLTWEADEGNGSGFLISATKVG